ncbi:uncharacterized protein LOC143859440 [Tasmannia lanceolata]|uniref:uncharacterized protein LOC143859440 n=1 Tax=Tasmannia lanceolata TaxID=3420 RepID=UPI00406447C8
MEGKINNINWVIEKVVSDLRAVRTSQKFSKEISMLDRLALEELKIDVRHKKISRESWILWERPVCGHIKHNIDGAAKENPGESGGGGVMRDSKAKVIIAFVYFYGTSTNMVIEARALLDGLRLCKAFGIVNLVVESDSKVLMDLISKKKSHPWFISSYWLEMMLLVDQL